MSVKIPSRWTESDSLDCKYAYEDGWYDGRDQEAYNTIAVDNFSKWLGDYRKEQRLSYKELGQLTGVNTGTLSNYINGGQTPHMGVAICILDALGYELCVRPKV